MCVGIRACKEKVPLPFQGGIRTLSNPKENFVDTFGSYFVLECIACECIIIPSHRLTLYFSRFKEEEGLV